MTRAALKFSKTKRTRLLIVAGLLAAATALGPMFARPTVAELQGPQASDRQVALAVSALLQRVHLARRPIDDEMSRRALDSFLKSLDPMKLYFYQSDIDEFMKNRDRLDDEIQKGDISFGYTIFNRLLKRIDERGEMIDSLIDEEHDFDTEEVLITERDDRVYPRDAAEARERWRKRIKYDMLIQKSDEVDEEEAKEKLHRRYSSFGKRMHQTDGEELMEMYLSALTTGYDPHTTYMSASTLKNFEISMQLELDGIGASLQSEDGYTTIHKIIPGGAADSDGRLKPEDRIVSVGQGANLDGEMVDVVDMKLNDVVKLIRGKRGTVVRLGVLPGGSGKQQVYAITRQRIELKDSEARGEVFEEGTKADGTPYKIGVIDLPSFYMDMEAAKRGDEEFKSTTRDVKRLLDGFKEQNVDAVMVDLRRNGGGSLTEAINLTGLFIESGPVVQVKGFDGRVEPYEDRDSSIAWSGPLVVLTSKFSASASEIFAGAIQDYRRGLIVGDRTTHGKGTVQQLLDLGQHLFRIPNAPKLGALKITIQKFYRPSGDSTQSRGVLSDVELPSITTHLDVGEADLDFALEFDRVDAREHDVFNMISPNMIQQLRAKSLGRLESSEDFERVLRNIDRYKEQKSKNSVTLNEQAFLAERAELDADRELEKQAEELNDPNRPVVKRDYYFNEALDVTLDYLDLLQKNQIALSRVSPR